MKFGLDDDTYERGKVLFDLAKRADEIIDIADYMLNHELRNVEEPNKDAKGTDYLKSIFYLYGNCEDMYDF